MKTDSPQTIYLKDYTPPAYRIPVTELWFDLRQPAVKVRARLTLERGEKTAANEALVLNGSGLNLLSVSLDDSALSEGQYHYDQHQLSIPDVPERFVLETTVEIEPDKNTTLEGLYRSNGVYCTQCEAEGFRHITFFADRPDVMSVFHTHILAAQQACPVLLSNGNPVDSGAQGSEHWQQWHDPYPKPAYLFALVAGDLACVSGTFQTASGRDVSLQFYTEHHNKEQCDHALQALQKAMAWDEQVFGLEYDLDLYMVVAVEDFNMGAMENKGLNVFNTKYVLATQQTATDQDFLGIESVIAHEYFHNWTGNRVTCRDWFQLSLKEGLTVFRDQEFSADTFSREIQRIQDVRILRSAQFAEDAGPMAHPVRPASYMEINNFYTVTVYNKGAEVVRMQHTLLGAEGFRKGMDLYFERYDGQAVTTDDFRQAMADANGRDLEQFQRWYEQAGTPVLKVQREYEAATQTLTLHLRQSCPPTPESEAKQPFLIPLRYALLDAEGQALALPDNGLIEVTEAEQSVQFKNMPAGVVPSLLRGFSAPVKLETDLSLTELALLMAHDEDGFARWEAGQQLALAVLLELLDQAELHSTEALKRYSQAYGQLLSDALQNPAFTAEAMQLPAEKYLAEQLASIDPLAIAKVRDFVLQQLATDHQARLQALYQAAQTAADYEPNAAQIGLRSLKNACLALMMRLPEADTAVAVAQFEAADNMTDQMAALSVLAQRPKAEREPYLQAFYEQWKDQALVVDKWFSVQASSRAEDTFETVQALLKHEAFTLKNPNRARALLMAFAMMNPRHFHRIDGAAYALIAEHVLTLNAMNPQLASRLVSVFLQWKRFSTSQQSLMKEQCERLLAAPDLSPDVFELLSKALADA